MSELTPLMKQYTSIKEKYHDAIVLFRLGDFYEMFGEDAKVASGILQIALTSRDKSKDDPMPMCGVPYFSVEGYISKLIKAGHKVAICEQVEDPKLAKGIVQREVVKVITPGTHVPEQPKENAYLMSIFPYQGMTGITVADLSTAEFTVYETDKPVEDEIARYEPREILCPKSLEENIHYKEVFRGFYVSHYDDWYFDHTESYKTLLKYFKVSSLDGYGCGSMTAAVSAAGAIISYLEESQRILTFKKITVLNRTSFMFLDSATKRNLELTRNLKDGSAEGSLLWVLDETLTPMGGRFMRNAIAKPLLSSAEIIKRQGAVEAIVEDYELMEDLRTTLRKIQDIERLTSRIISKSAWPRDLAALKISIDHLPKIKRLLMSSTDSYIKETGGAVSEFVDLQDLISFGIVENPPANPRDGGIIRKGYNKEVDELRNISVSGKDFIARLEADEKQRTGISSLKVGFNRVFGYYIEVTKANLHLVPDDYIRKQTLANCERFITPDLKEYETKVLGAEDRLKELEYEIFMNILEKMQKYADQLLETSARIAVIDFLLSLATVARRYDYIKPSITGDDVIEIADGRHPVIERLISTRGISAIDEKFIPNNTLIDCNENRLLVITGPNMAGKSTYMRQTALIVLMSQIGSFIPAGSARIGIADRIFTRIGASDYITKGQSTFMVEMIETANILNNATEKSLILLDEVGRGTSTFDGISIAWAVAEHLAHNINARTLFATHYNELTDLALIMDGVKNYNVVVKEWGDEVIFLRKIEKGPADKSYGIQVARLAGLPDKVIEGAKVVLDKLEKKEAGMLKPRAAQMDLFFAGDPIKLELLSLDMENLTPQKALKKLAELKKKAEGSA
ncbi:MAG: DNA mismatch repair protein MutS [Nitrospirae bacterium GWB2_47_37]|nr:MAG: DNA mismatch repair protein MutS [Nitrospirae bacterium GWA2_46_11]OGW24967.1 MAG: DNA mismatch repair protein MutS [Nitrospirae bacterium GWB2_47_37]HAK88206.1 DNA mismatch repair protein MutS [Nitrospiraceae bacterium]